MGDPETSEASADSEAAPTQKLAFDKDFEKEIPQFLKKDKKEKSVEETSEDLEPEGEDPISEDNSKENEEMEQIAFGGKQAKTAGVPKSLADMTAEMTIEQLKKQQEEIDRRIKEKQSVEKQAVIDQVVNVVNQYGIPIDELVEALGGMKFRRKGTKAKAKYRDPASGSTWSGRGKEPLWIKGQADRTPFEI